MYKVLLWFLKIGTVLNLYFLFLTFQYPLDKVDSYLLIPAQIFFFVSAYRCFFPVNYVSNAVLHDSKLSSVFITRLLATFVEVAYIYQFSYLLRIINNNQILYIDIISWFMVLQVAISQLFVWSAILLKNEKFYYYEEIGWAIIFILNTIISVILYLMLDILVYEKLLLYINFLFGFIYLPWQWVHLYSIYMRVGERKFINKNQRCNMLDNFNNSINLRKKSIDPKQWGGVIGMMWMYGYWVIVIPPWIFLIINTYSN